MPANRSRTQNWRRNLEQIHERGGTIEIAIAAAVGDSDAEHLMWRVRILGLDETHITVETPLALGRSIEIRQGIRLVAVMTIGQNRWRFATECAGACEVEDHGRRIAALRLAVPAGVRRCQRRTHDRVETSGLSLPRVEIWPLLDPASVVMAERACELGAMGTGGAGAAPEVALPDVGPRFEGTLTNIGGGGIGIDCMPDQAATLGRHKVFWLRFELPPAVSGPICASAKLVHTRMQSNMHMQAGLAFDFSFHPEHRNFVMAQIEQYIEAMQDRQAA